jgi:hypothetical protein
MLSKPFHILNSPELALNLAKGHIRKSAELYTLFIDTLSLVELERFKESFSSLAQKSKEELESSTPDLKDREQYPELLAYRVAELVHQAAAIQEVEHLIYPTQKSFIDILLEYPQSITQEIMLNHLVPLDYLIEGY